MIVSAYRIKKQIEYLQSIGIETDSIVHQIGLSIEDLSDVNKTFEFDLLNQVLNYALKVSKDEFYGLKFGQNPQLAGTIGMMCASCKDLKEAFVNGCKFFQLQGDFAVLEFNEDGEISKIRYIINPEWKLIDALSMRHEVEAMFSYLVLVLKLNSNHLLKPLEINFNFEAPQNTLLYQDVFGVFPNFECVYNEIVLRSRDLRIPMKAFNPETFQLIKSHVENQLKQRSNDFPITEKVKHILLSSFQYYFPDIETVANKLKTSPRTLQRQLSSENTTFKAILQQTKFEIAKQLLQQSEFTISEISYTLGYSDLGNFSRSFKNYTGLSPQQFRDKGNRN